MKVEVQKVSKDRFSLLVNGNVILQAIERSEVRYIIQELDNKINIG